MLACPTRRGEDSDGRGVDGLQLAHHVERLRLVACLLRLRDLLLHVVAGVASNRRFREPESSRYVPLSVPGDERGLDCCALCV
jgi:hypothetical protein